jgi:hypothetical protein
MNKQKGKRLKAKGFEGSRIQGFKSKKQKKLKQKVGSDQLAV